MKKYFIGFLMLVTSLSSSAQSFLSIEDLRQYVANEPHVKSVDIGVCSMKGELGNAFTYPRVRCYIITTDEVQTYERLKSEFPIGSTFEGSFVVVLL